VKVGVRGSEGVVRECVGPWEMHHALGMRHALGSPPNSMSSLIKSTLP
jgi:hypothetical protein